MAQKAPWWMPMEYMQIPLSVNLWEKPAKCGLHGNSTIEGFPSISYTSPFLIIPTSSEITANTIRIWIRPLALYTKTPSNQPMINTTAIRYKILLIVFLFGNR